MPEARVRVDRGPDLHAAGGLAQRDLEAVGRRRHRVARLVAVEVCREAQQGRSRRLGRTRARASGLKSANRLVTLPLPRQREHGRRALLGLDDDALAVLREDRNPIGGPNPCPTPSRRAAKHAAGLVAVTKNSVGEAVRVEVAQREVRDGRLRSRSCKTEILPGRRLVLARRQPHDEGEHERRDHDPHGGALYARALGASRRAGDRSSRRRRSTPSGRGATGGVRVQCDRRIVVVFGDPVTSVVIPEDAIAFDHGPGARRVHLVGDARRGGGAASSRTTAPSRCGVEPGLAPLRVPLFLSDDVVLAPRTSTVQDARFGHGRRPADLGVRAEALARPRLGPHGGDRRRPIVPQRVRASRAAGSASS